MARGRRRTGLWDDLGAEAGFKPLLAGHGGTSPPLWSARPLTSLADLEGGKIFAPGLGPDVARALGAEPVALEPQEVDRSPFAAARSAFAEWGGALHSMAIGLHRSAVHATGTASTARAPRSRLRVRLCHLGEPRRRRQGGFRRRGRRRIPRQPLGSQCARDHDPHRAHASRTASASRRFRPTSPMPCRASPRRRSRISQGATSARGASITATWPSRAPSAACPRGLRSPRER